MFQWPQPFVTSWNSVGGCGALRCDFSDLMYSYPLHGLYPRVPLSPVSFRTVCRYLYVYRESLFFSRLSLPHFSLSIPACPPVSRKSLSLPFFLSLSPSLFLSPPLPLPLSLSLSLPLSLSPSLPLSLAPSPSLYCIYALCTLSIGNVHVIIHGRVRHIRRGQRPRKRVRSSRRHKGSGESACKGLSCFCCYHRCVFCSSCHAVLFFRDTQRGYYYLHRMEKVCVSLGVHFLLILFLSMTFPLLSPSPLLPPVP